MANPQPQRMTASEYLAFEREADDRHEYVDGTAIQMAGSSLEHSEIATAIASEFRVALRGKGCHVHGSDIKVFVETPLRFRYPDAAVVCGEQLTHPESEQVLMNPLLLVEVLSDSTRRIDQTMKLAEYMRIATVEEILLVEQNAPLITQYTRLRLDDDREIWQFASAIGMNSRLILPSIEIELLLANVYEGLDVDDAVSFQ